MSEAKEAKPKRGRPKLELLKASDLTDFSTASPRHALPEAVAPSTRFSVGEWRPGEGGGPPRTSVCTQEFVVPLTDDAVARGLRLHELTHLKWSPADGPKCALKAGIGMDQLEIVAAIEDARVNLLANGAGLFDRIRPGYWQVPATQHVGNPALSAERRLLLAAIAYATAEPHVENLLDKDMQRMLRECLEPVLNHPRTFDSTVASAKRFARFFAHQRASQAYQQAAAAEHGIQAAQASSDAVNGECDFDKPYEDDAWAPMQIVHPPRPHAVASATAGKTRRATDTGVVFRYPHRFLIDQRVFSSTRRAPGGTLVIDHSGSMNIDPADITVLLAVAPHATVADYGARGDPAVGTLRILAAQQRVAASARIESNNEIGGHNCIDGPVADWLAGQPAPRVWVTDGQWTGDQKHFVTETLRAKVLKACAAAKILILPSVQAAVTYFASRGERKRSIAM